MAMAMGGGITAKEYMCYWRALFFLASSFEKIAFYFFYFEAIQYDPLLFKIICRSESSHVRMWTRNLNAIVFFPNA